MDKAKKFDSDKIPIDLIPSEALFEIGEVLKFGKEKYGRSNWSKGIQHSRLIAAAMRHLLQYNSGENLDKESGRSHIAHCATNLVMLLWLMEHRKDLDDRWVKDNQLDNEIISDKINEYNKHSEDPVKEYDYTEDDIRYFSQLEMEIRLGYSPKILTATEEMNNKYPEMRITITKPPYFDPFKQEMVFGELKNQLSFDIESAVKEEDET